MNKNFDIFIKEGDKLIPIDAIKVRDNLTYEQIMESNYIKHCYLKKDVNFFLDSEWTIILGK
jgi:hypothetical protein